jgi:hypothetical protein
MIQLNLNEIYGLKGLKNRKKNPSSIHHSIRLDVLIKNMHRFDMFGMFMIKASQKIHLV